MKLKNVVIASIFAFGGLTFLAVDVNAQALPNSVFTAPAYKPGAAVAQGITQTLIRRGFASNDPRILQTISAVGTRTAATVTAAGTGASMLATVARLSPYVTTGILIYQGVTWYLDSTTGKVTLQPAGTSTQPIYSNGIQAGQLAWQISGGYWGSPEEAFAYMVQQTNVQYPDAVFTNVSVNRVNTTSATVSYNYSYPTSLHISGPGTKTANALTYTGITCPAGSGYVSGTGCTSAGLTNPNSGLSASQVQSFTMPEAYTALSPAVKAAPLSPELAAETSNRLWRDASAQPGYQGVPWSAVAPTTAPDFAPYAQAQPSSWPSTSDWGSTPAPTTNPIVSPESNPNAIPTAPSGSAKLDLGTDPGTPTPTLEDTPTDLFKPISDLLKPWTTWQVPAHSSTCPTWQAYPSIAGHVFSIDLSYHCTFAEQFRAAITAAALACWLVIAAFIILSA
jgi:hypothetical protein